MTIGKINNVSDSNVGKLVIPSSNIGKIGGGGFSVAPDQYTKLLLHMTGTPGSQSIVDSSLSAHSPIVSGSTVISSTTAKFGSTSCYFNGAGDWIILPASNDWAFGTENFTIDTWINITNFDDARQIWGQAYAGTNWCLFMISGNRLYFTYATSGGGTTILGPTLTSGVWHHVAVVRNNNTVTIYLNGSSSGGTPGSCNQNFNNSSIRPTIGRYYDNSNPTFWMYGYMQEYRVSKGIARWTTDFTPPSAPY